LIRTFFPHDGQATIRPPPAPLDDRPPVAVNPSTASLVSLERCHDERRLRLDGRAP